MVNFDFLRQISHTTSILDVLDYYDIEHHSTGFGRYKAVCPFHNDHDPSLVLYVHPEHKDESFYCFVDHAGGDVFRFIQLMEQDFKKAWSVLCHIRNIDDLDADKMDELDKATEDLQKEKKKEEVSVESYNYQISTMYRDFLKKNAQCKNIIQITQYVDQRFFELDKVLDSDISPADMRQYFLQELQHLTHLQSLVIPEASAV